MLFLQTLKLYKALQTKRKLHGRMMKTVQKLTDSLGAENPVAAKVLIADSIQNRVDMLMMRLCHVLRRR